MLSEAEGLYKADTDERSQACRRPEDSHWKQQLVGQSSQFATALSPAHSVNHSTICHTQRPCKIADKDTDQHCSAC